VTQPTMPIREFRDLGLLQEVNRRILHPLGLALFVVVEADGTERLGGVVDYRSDPEGMAFSDLDAEKVRQVAELESQRRSAREAALGYWVQPVPVVEP
jgi:hypothetical protein